MPTITITHEDGTGVVNANSYVSLTNADAYAATVLDNSTWLSSSDEKRKQGLISATRILDHEVNWFGIKRFDSGALRWPRSNVFDDDGLPVAEDSVPVPIQNATVELAMWLIQGGKLVERSGIGLKRLVVDVIELDFDKQDKRDLIPGYIRRMLVEYGSVFSHDNIRYRKLVRT